MEMSQKTLLQIFSLSGMAYFGRPRKETYWKASPAKFVRSMVKDEIFRSEMAGSGGYGDPFERDPNAVAEDVRQDKMSLEHAAEEYGVVVDPVTFAVDLARTAERRAAGGGAAQ